MKKLRKSALSIAITVLLLVSCTFVASATEAIFTKRSVDSNSYSYITTAKKETTSTTASVQVTNIYKADGSSSWYTTVYAKATSTGTPLSVVKGKYYDLTIPSSNRSAGSWVPLYSMGNVPWLDCQISGYWIVH